jgi:hypothetical protein
MSNHPNLAGKVGIANRLERRSAIVALATAGIAGPAIFTVIAFVYSLLRQDHSLVTHPISALATGPSGCQRSFASR